MGLETPAAITFLLQNSGQPDDILTITPKTADTYFVEFYQKTIGDRTSLTMYSQSLSDYIQKFLVALQFDLHIPEYLQVEIPGFPCILLRPRSQTPTQRTDLVHWIQGCVDFLKVQGNWPVIHNPGPRKPAGSIVMANSIV